MYLTEQKQELMVKNLNYLMRKNNITNPIMQEGIFGRTDKNGTLVAKLRGGKRKFTIDDAICISEFYNIQTEIFTTVDLTALEDKGIEINEALLIKKEEFEKDVFYSFREIGAYSFTNFILLGVLLFILTVGSILSHFVYDFSTYLHLTIIVILALFFIFFILKGLSDFIYSKKTFILKESKKYYFINTAKAPIKAYSLFIGFLIPILLAMFIIFGYGYQMYLIPISIIGFFIVAIHIYSLVLLCLPKEKYMQKIDYTLYVFEAIRKYSLILLLLGFVSFIFLFDIAPLYEIIFCGAMAVVIIVSEFANRLIINYYEHYTGREERIQE